MSNYDLNVYGTAPRERLLSAKNPAVFFDTALIKPTELQSDFHTGITVPDSQQNSIGCARNIVAGVTTLLQNDTFNRVVSDKSSSSKLTILQIGGATGSAACHIVLANNEFKGEIIISINRSLMDRIADTHLYAALSSAQLSKSGNNMHCFHLVNDSMLLNTIESLESDDLNSVQAQEINCSVPHAKLGNKPLSQINSESLSLNKIADEVEIAFRKNIFANLQAPPAGSSISEHESRIREALGQYKATIIDLSNLVFSSTEILLNQFDLLIGEQLRRGRRLNAKIIDSIVAVLILDPSSVILKSTKNYVEGALGKLSSEKIFTLESLKKTLLSAGEKSNRISTRLKFWKKSSPPLSSEFSSDVALNCVSSLMGELAADLQNLFALFSEQTFLKNPYFQEAARLLHYYEVPNLQKFFRQYCSEHREQVVGYYLLQNYSINFVYEVSPLARQRTFVYIHNSTLFKLPEAELTILKLRLSKTWQVPIEHIYILPNSTDQLKIFSFNLAYINEIPDIISIVTSIDQDIKDNSLPNTVSIEHYARKGIDELYPLPISRDKGIIILQEIFLYLMLLPSRLLVYKTKYIVKDKSEVILEGKEVTDLNKLEDKTLDAIQTSFYSYFRENEAAIIKILTDGLSPRNQTILGTRKFKSTCERVLLKCENNIEQRNRIHSI